MTEKMEATTATTGEDLLLQDVAELLLIQGWAWVYLPTGSDLWKGENKAIKEKLIKLESKARKEKKGLWADKKPVEPWKFRGIP